MERQRLILILLFLTVLASGCISGGSNGQESSRSITVHQLSVSQNQIYEGTSVSVSLDLVNTGNVPANVSMGKEGRRIMKDYCTDIFEISSNTFSVTTSGERDGQRVALEPDDELRLRWTLDQKGDVPLYGQKCDIKFQVPFNYSVSSYKQVQIKENPEVENTELVWESSSGPLLFALETLGTTTNNPNVFVADEEDEDKSITLLMQLRNTGQEDYRKGVIDVKEESLKVRASKPLDLFEGFTSKNLPDASREECKKRYDDTRFGLLKSLHCIGKEYSGEDGLRWDSFGSYSEGKDPRCDVSDDSIRMLEGESRVLKCDIPVPSRESLDSPSAISEILAKVEYTYLKDIGSRTVEVQRRGN